MASNAGPTETLSELRIILLGCNVSAKSSSGNTILGTEQFKLETTAQCEKRQGDVAGRQVTVVDTPGWWRSLPLEFTTELIKQEIVVSTSLCPPGPHVFLLVLDISWRAYCKSVEEHMQLLGDRVWSHTIILFTFGDKLGDKSIEQYIESEGEALQRLVEKCGYRYHVFNNENRGDDTQVTELLEKIEEMVAANTVSCFEIDRSLLEETEKKRKAEVERATQRQMMVIKERESIRSKMDDFPLSELRIILLGHDVSGKSSSGNTILCTEEFRLDRTASCEKRQGDVAERHVTVVDTPGWWRNQPLNSTSELIKKEIVRSTSLCPPGPHVFLLVIDVDMSHTAYCKSVEEHMQLLGDRVWHYIIILFTCGDSLGDKSIEQYIESEGEALQRLVERCGSRYHVFNNENRGDDTQVTELLDKIEEMVTGNRGGHYEAGSPPTPSLPLRKSRSKDFPPNMSEDDSQSRWSLTSSGSAPSGGSVSSGSLTSISTSNKSSGYGSLTSISESGVGSTEPSQRMKLPGFIRKTLNMQGNVKKSKDQHPK